MTFTRKPDLLKAMASFSSFLGFMFIVENLESLMKNQEK